MNDALKVHLDERLADIRWEHTDSHAVFSQIKGEVKVKRKLSLGLVLVLALVLIAAVAVAATLVWEDFAKRTQIMEDATGPYQSWTIESKMEIIEQIQANGLFANDERVSELLSGKVQGEAAHKLADQVIGDLTGRRVDDIGVFELTEIVRGAASTWNYKQWAWWQTVLDQRGEQGRDIGRFCLPSGDDLSYEDVRSIAAKAVAERYQISKEQVDACQEASECYFLPFKPEMRIWRFTFRSDEAAYYTVRIIAQTGKVVNEQ